MKTSSRWSIVLFGLFVAVLTAVGISGGMSGCSGGEGGGDKTTLYIDADGDGYGSNASDAATIKVSTKDAVTDPSGAISETQDEVVYINNNSDCDDSDGNINPAMGDIAGDGIDSNCDGADEDAAGFSLGDPNETDDDGDGYTENQDDCDDANAAIYPGAAETNDDGVDSDCDGNDNSPITVLPTAVEVQKLRFTGQNLTMPNSGIVATGAWEAYSLSVFFNDDAYSLSGCTMGDLEIAKPEGIALHASAGSFDFIIDLVDYASRDCADPAGLVGISADELLKLANINRIEFSTTVTDSWGIERLEIEAINSGGTATKFYRNLGVSAFVGHNVNSEIGASYLYPFSGNCMGSVSGSYFENFPGGHQTGGHAPYKVYPKGTLAFRPTDYWVSVTITVDDSPSSGTTNSLLFKFKFDCADSGYVKLFYNGDAGGLQTLSNSETAFFYTPNLNEIDLASGVRFKLADDDVEDNLKFSRYAYAATQAWSLDGMLKKYDNGWNRTSIPDCTGGSECVTLQPGETTTRGILLTTIEME